MVYNQPELLLSAFCNFDILLSFVTIQWFLRIFILMQIYYPAGGRVLFSIDLFVCIFVCFFVSKITRKRLDRFAWNFQGRCVVTMGRPEYIFHQFRETAWCSDVQHGDGVCCALAPQLVTAWSIKWILSYDCIVFFIFLPFWGRFARLLLFVFATVNGAWIKRRWWWMKIKILIHVRRRRISVAA